MEFIFGKWNEFTCRKYSWEAMQTNYWCVQGWHLFPGLVTLVSCAIWFSEQFLPPPCSPPPDFTDGRPYRPTKAHHHHPSSLKHHQSDSCWASQPCSEPWHHFKSYPKGVSCCKPAMLEGYFLAHLPVLFCWNLKSERTAFSRSMQFPLWFQDAALMNRVWSFEYVPFGMKNFLHHGSFMCG